MSQLSNVPNPHIIDAACQPCAFISHGPHLEHFSTPQKIVCCLDRTSLKRYQSESLHSYSANENCLGQKLWSALHVHFIGIYFNAPTRQLSSYP